MESSWDNFDLKMKEFHKVAKEKDQNGRFKISKENFFDYVCKNYFNPNKITNFSQYFIPSEPATNDSTYFSKLQLILKSKKSFFNDNSYLV